MPEGGEWGMPSEARVADIGPVAQGVYIWLGGSDKVFSRVQAEPRLITYTEGAQVTWADGRCRQ